VWGELQSAVPVLSTIYFPKGRYYVDPKACPFGFVLSKRISILGESSGIWDGTNISDATVFLNPITLNVVGGTFVKSVAFDARPGLLGANDGISSGAPSTSAGGTTIDNVLYVGSPTDWLAHPVHAILLQSGPNNIVQNVHVYYAFHAAAIRASNTFISNVSTWDVVDVIVKANAESGNAENDSIEGLSFDGDPGQGGGLFFTSQSDGFMNANNSASGITCHNSSYCLAFEVSGGGQMDGITVSNVSSRDGENGFFAYPGDGNPSDSMGAISLRNIELSNLSDTGIQNDIASKFCVGDYSYSSILGPPAIGAIQQC
jgi:hypothetical protein